MMLDVTQHTNRPTPTPFTITRASRIPLRIICWLPQHINNR